MDRFKQMIDGLKEVNQDLEATLSERIKLAKSGQSTGRVSSIVLFPWPLYWIQLDYQLKSKVGNAMIDLKAIERLSYEYQKEAFKYSQL